MSGVVRVCEAGAIDHIVTDGAIPAAARAAIDDAGIEVTIV
jgi:DeoR/GlpR family transcriptional regulator of sugar metabolism